MEKLWSGGSFSVVYSLSFYFWNTNDCLETNERHVLTQKEKHQISKQNLKKKLRSCYVVQWELTLCFFFQRFGFSEAHDFYAQRKKGDLSFYNGRMVSSTKTNTKSLKDPTRRICCQFKKTDDFCFCLLWRRSQKHFEC